MPKKKGDATREPKHVGQARAHVEAADAKLRKTLAPLIEKAQTTTLDPGEFAVLLDVGMKDVYDMKAANDYLSVTPEASGLPLEEAARRMRVLMRLRALEDHRLRRWKQVHRTKRTVADKRAFWESCRPGMEKKAADTATATHFAVSVVSVRVLRHREAKAGRRWMGDEPRR
jgi:hypothetical protein